MFSILLSLLVGFGVAWVYWKIYDLFLSRYDFYRLSPFSYYFGKITGSLVVFAFPAFFVFGLTFQGEPPAEFDPNAYTCAKESSESTCLKEKFELLSSSQLYKMTGNDVTETISKTNSDISLCSRKATSTDERDACEIPVYERGITTLVGISKIGKRYYFDLEKCADRYCKAAIEEKVKAGYAAYAQERYNKWYAENVIVETVPEGEKNYQLGHEPSCRNGVPYLVCQDRRLLKLENKMTQLEPAAMYDDVSPFYYHTREYLKNELGKCGQDPNCYEHYYKLGIDAYAYIIEAGKSMRTEQARCSGDQSCWDRAKQSAQIQVSTQLEFLSTNRNQ